MSASTSIGHIPLDGDNTAGHNGGIGVINSADGVLVSPFGPTPYSGFSVANTSANVPLRVIIAWAPGTILPPGANDFDGIIPPRGHISYSAGKDCIATISVQAIDPTSAAAGAFTDAAALTAFAPSSPITFYANLTNG
jgi:hypothetical protein